jgi:osmotically-inducible protein OsmY
MTTTRNYSDTEIFAAARKALDDHPHVPHDVRLHVDCGRVTLTGTVRRRQERAEVEDIVRRVDGVLRLVNRITVANGPSPQDLEAPEST